jgi:hypothetical protein
MELTHASLVGAPEQMAGGNAPVGDDLERTLSALVIAHNEERRLAACLERLRFADEIVVVLDNAAMLRRSSPVVLRSCSSKVSGSTRAMRGTAVSASAAATGFSKWMPTSEFRTGSRPKSGKRSEPQMQIGT